MVKEFGFSHILCRVKQSNCTSMSLLSSIFCIDKYRYINIYILKMQSFDR